MKQVATKRRARNAEPECLIYGLIDPTSKLIRYVGLSTTGLARPRSHRHKSCPDTHCRRWVRKLQAAGLDYTIVVLEVISNPAKLPEAECWWIAYGRASGWPLTNIADGGGAYDPAEMRHRAARRARIAREKTAQKEEQKRRVAAEEEASRKRADKLRALLELEVAVEGAKAAVHNTDFPDDVRCCLKLFEVIGSDTRQWELVHYFVVPKTISSLECACGYVEPVDTFTAAEIETAVAKLRQHIKDAGSSGTRVPGATEPASLSAFRDG